MEGIAGPLSARGVAPDTVRNLPSGRSSHPLRVRVRTALHRAELTRALAAGAEPSARPELALRAQQLTSTRMRRTLTHTLRRTIAEAHRPAAAHARIVIIDRRAVLDGEQVIDALIGRLESPSPVCAEGMAILDRILTNADRSPLYNPSEPGTLRRLICVATSALDTEPAQPPASRGAA
jgi:hypothetical protein